MYMNIKQNLVACDFMAYLHSRIITSWTEPLQRGGESL